MAEPSRRLMDLFRRVFPDNPQRDLRIVRAPGRVNLIGEHTDYNLGLVCPIAIERDTHVAAAPNGDQMLRLWSENERERWEWPVEQVVDAAPADDWTDYVVGVAQQLHRLGVPLRAMDLVIDSTVPTGSGLSSSAALEVSSALALAGEQVPDRLALVQLCQRAEREFVGVPVGIMDQYVSVFGEENAAIMLDCRTLRHEAVELPAGAALVVVNSMVKHALGSSAYAQRVAECAEAARILGVTDLSATDSAGVSAAADRLPDVIARRARHVTTENERVRTFAASSRHGDLEAMGRLFSASHASLRDDYEVSCEELDFLADTALQLPGVYGARMTGGGFGGCTINLLQPEAVAGFTEEIRRRYEQQYQLTPDVFPVRPSRGAGPA